MLDRAIHRFGDVRERQDLRAGSQQLSERRAKSVAAYLSSHGVAGTRVVTVGAGEGHPVASNETEEGRAQNRRVEITIVPVTQENVEKAKQG